MLHGIREGVVALDADERVTLVNDVAVSLLRLPGDPVGRTLAELGIDGGLLDVFTGQVAGEDEIVVGTDRVLVLNRMPVRVRGRDLGSVTTLRDRSELVSLQRELGSTRTVSETLAEGGRRADGGPRRGGAPRRAADPLGRRVRADRRRLAGQRAAVSRVLRLRSPGRRRPPDRPPRALA